jgi:hypothetical protein
VELKVERGEGALVGVPVEQVLPVVVVGAETL